MSEAELEKKIQALPAEQQAGCLRFVLGAMSVKPMSMKPAWPAMKEAVELYLKEYGIKTC